MGAHLSLLGCHLFIGFDIYPRKSSFTLDLLPLFSSSSGGSGWTFCLTFLDANSKSGGWGEDCTMSWTFEHLL